MRLSEVQPNCIFFFNQVNSNRSLHKETKCGQFHSWNCFECAPLLSSEEAYNEHMAIHAAKVRQCGDGKIGFAPIKSEVASNGMQLGTCSVYIEDPILLEVKREDDSYAEQVGDIDKHESQNLFDR